MPNPQMFYPYNPMMMMPQMNNMDAKYPMSNPGFYYVPVYIDPSKMPKDMNQQNMPMFYPMGMYQPNFNEQYDNNKK